MGALTTTDDKKIYTGDGVVLIFPFPYLFYADSDLVVSLKDTTSDASPVVQTITTHYTIGAGEAGDPDGGNVTMVTAPTATEELIIERVVDITQESAYTNYNRFPAPTVEKNLNRLTMMVQRLTEEVARCLKYDVDVDVSTVSSVVEGLLVAGSVPSLKTGALGAEWVDLDTDAIAAAVAATAADVVLTNADVVLTNADVALTNADVVLTNADVVLADAAATAAAASAAAAISMAVTNNISWSCSNATQVVINAGGEFAGVDSGSKFSFASGVTMDISGTGGVALGLDTGAEASSKWYYIIGLGNSAAPTVSSAWFVEASTYAAFVVGDLPSGYTDYKYLGAVYNDGSSDFLQGEYQNNKFFPYTVTSQGTGSATFVDLDYSTNAPPNCREAEINFINATAGTVFWRKNGSSGTGSRVCESSQAANNTLSVLLDSSQIVEVNTSAGTLSAFMNSYTDTLQIEGQ